MKKLVLAIFLMSSVNVLAKSHEIKSMDLVSTQKGELLIVMHMACSADLASPFYS